MKLIIVILVLIVVILGIIFLNKHPNIQETPRAEQVETQTTTNAPAIEEETTMIGTDVGMEFPIPDADQSLEVQ